MAGAGLKDLRRASLRDVQALRGIAAAMVMCYHTGTIYAHSTGDLLFGNLFRGGFLGVDVFFVLSGFVMYWAHAQDFGHAGQLPVFIKKRIVRIFPLYWVILAAKALKDSSMPSLLVLASAVFLIPYPHVPYINVAWTLSYELFFYMAIGCMIVLPKGRMTWLPVLALLALALFPYSAGPPGDDFGATLLAFPFNPHLAEFLMGMVVGSVAMRHHEKAGKWWKELILAGGLAFVALFIAATWLSFHVGPLAEGQAYDLAELQGNALFKQAIWLMGLPFSVLLLGLVVGEISSGASRIPGLDWLGDISYSLYLVHGFVIYSLLRNEGVAEFVMAHQWAAFGLMALAVAAAGLAHYFVEKPLIKFFKPWVAAKA